MGTVVRLRIRLTQEELDVVDREARRLGLSRSAFLRSALRTSLPVAADRPWMRVAGSIATGDADASQRIDAWVYGAEASGRAG